MSGPSTVSDATWPRVKKTADTLERGDVIMIDRRRAVVIEPSDTVGSVSLSEVFRFGRREYMARDCCEPRICLLGRTGRMTYEVSYIILPNRKRVEVRAYLDIDARSAVPRPIAS